jgi:hypothetical protein
MYRRAGAKLLASTRSMTHQASVGIVLVALSAPPLVVSCRKAQPVRFGASVRSIHSDLPSVDGEHKEDCPLCKKYSQGPCADLFQRWLACTDQYRDSNDGHTRNDKCAEIAEPLSECLKKHEDFYDKISVHDDDEPNGLQDEWAKVVEQVDSSNTSQSFPSHLKPTLEYRPQTGVGIAGFVWECSTDRPLIMACVKDTKTGNLLAAGSMDDLFDYEGRGILKLVIPSSTKAVIVSALYDGGDDEDDLWFTHHVLVPR